MCRETHCWPGTLQREEWHALERSAGPVPGDQGAPRTLPVQNHVHAHIPKVAFPGHPFQNPTTLPREAPASRTGWTLTADGSVDLAIPGLCDASHTIYFRPEHAARKSVFGHSKQVHSGVIMANKKLGPFGQVFEFWKARAPPSVLNKISRHWTLWIPHRRRLFAEVGALNSVRRSL